MCGLILESRTAYRLSSGHNPAYVLLRAGYVPLKRRQNLEIRTRLIGPPYGFGSTQTRRSIFSARRTFSSCELRAGYVFTTRTCDVRAPYVDVRAPYVHTLPPQVFFKKSHCHLFCVPHKFVVRAWPVLTLCAFSLNVQKRKQFYGASTCSALTTYVVRTDLSSI